MIHIKQDNARRLEFARPLRHLLATAQAGLWLHKKGFGRRSIVTQSLYLKRDLLMSRPFATVFQRLHHSPGTAFADRRTMDPLDCGKLFRSFLKEENDHGKPGPRVIDTGRRPDG